MKKVGVFLLVTLVAFPIVYYNLKSDPYITDDKPPEKPYYPRLTFAISILKQLQNDKPNESVFYSPHSLYEALLLTFFTVSDETEKQLKKNVRFQNETIEFSSVNKLYVTTELKIRDSVGNLLGRNNIESLNFFEEPAQYTAHINNFVEEFTKKQIRNLIPPSLISQGTTFAIVNAAYFKGKWITPFDEKLTQQEAFYKEDGDKIFVDMMRQSKHENIEFEC
ncbi:serine protease inhibitor 88Ea-like, partial [Sitodiplosis mosellana]|uniref:serine protease inhibitor 88Ea-like n=1 Tax=Sitodiplosis mosellana TaxID=263140 RepID=UPI002445138C